MKKTRPESDAKRLRAPYLFRRDELDLGSEPADQVFVRRVGNNPVELRTIVVDQADILRNDVVYLPVIADEMSFVINRILFSFGGHNLAGDIGIVTLDALADVDDFFVGVGLDDTGIGALEHIGKEPDKLVLLLGCAPAPIRAEGASRHLGEIEARKQNLSQLITAII